MPPRKNYPEADEQRLNAVVQHVTKHAEEIRGHLSEEDIPGTWMWLRRLQVFLNETVEWPT